jgi:hypothetical protein
MRVILALLFLSTPALAIEPGTCQDETTPPEIQELCMRVQQIYNVKTTWTSAKSIFVMMYDEYDNQVPQLTKEICKIVPEHQNFTSFAIVTDSVMRKVNLAGDEARFSSWFTCEEIKYGYVPRLVR